MTAIGEEAGDDPVARLDAADMGSDLLDDTRELMAEDGAGLDRDPLVVEVEVRPSDRRRGDPDQSIVRVLDRRLGDVVDANLLETLKRDRLHFVDLTLAEAMLPVRAWRTRNGFGQTGEL